MFTGERDKIINVKVGFVKSEVKNIQESGSPTLYVGFPHGQSGPSQHIQKRG